MTLHLYFARRYLQSFAAIFAAIFVILSLIDMVEQARMLENGGGGFGDILTLTLLNVPQAVYRVLPLITILAAIALFVNFSRTSEMVVARASGRSALTSVAAPALVAFAIGCVGVAAMNPIVAATIKQYDVVADRLSQNRTRTLSVGPGGLWLREASGDGQTVIHARRVNFDGSVLRRVTFFDFNAEDVPVRRIDAQSAELSEDAWTLRDAKIWSLLPDQNPEASATVKRQMTLPTDLSREEISDGFGAPYAVPIWDLPAFIERLEAAGFSARQHRVWLQMELALPVLLGAMVLVAAGFTLRPARFGQTGIMVVMALSLGFTLYFIRNFAQILGENDQIPILLAAWGPPLATMLLPLGLLLHLEDG